jgi:hypothetical protein
VRNVVREEERLAGDLARRLHRRTVDRKYSTIGAPEPEPPHVEETTGTGR